MTKETVLLLGLTLPFLGTVLGGLTVFFIKKGIGKKMRAMLYGFASGVMLAASVWSLLLPAIEMSEGGMLPVWFPPVTGLLFGMLSLVLADKILGASMPELSEGGSSALLFFAVTLHNIPEGMAVGVVLAAMLGPSAQITAVEALPLAIGIAIQNFPEGAIVSAPMGADGRDRGKAFLYSVCSGVVEPLASILTILLTAVVIPILPYVLSFAAGAMIYVVVEELVPQIQEEKENVIGNIGIALGFALMMLLDVALG